MKDTIEMESILDLSSKVNSAVLPRWQRKQLAAGGKVAPSSKKLSSTPSSKSRRSQTSLLNKTPGRKMKRQTPNSKKTGSKSDRFIPHRPSMDMDLCRYSMTKDFENMDNSDDVTESYKKSLAANLLGQQEKESRVLAFRNKAPAAPDNFQNNMRVMYTQNKCVTQAPVKPSRHIPSAPCRILDAPELVDDYYLNLLAWGSGNVLAVALGPSVYLWNAATGSIEELMTCQDEDDYICSVSWSDQSATHLAIGTSDAKTQLWDVSSQRRLRTMNGHNARVGALSWNGHLLSSGSRDSNIVHHDVRIQQHAVATLSGHQQEICGLKWSPDGNYLASGGNDNLLNIWDASGASTQSPRYTLTDHNAAVKALAWCPWERNLLASGGGTADRTIKFWNAGNGALLNSKDTGSQVCSLLWSTTEKELLSSHGYSQNELCLWKYPSMTKVKELHGHTARVLHLAASPDSSTVVSAAADETLRFWNVFAPEQGAKKIPLRRSSSSNRRPAFTNIMGIR